MHESSILGAYMEGVVQYEQRAYLRSVTGRRGTSQKDPYPSRLEQKDGPHMTNIGRSVTLVAGVEELREAQEW